MGPFFTHMLISHNSFDLSAVLKILMFIKTTRSKKGEIMINHLKKISLSLLIFLSFTNLASAETTMSAEGQYIFNSLGFYLGGVLVAFMAAGFCMLESGLVTTKSVSTIAAKNIGKFAICSLIFFSVVTI